MIKGSHLVSDTSRPDQRDYDQTKNSAAGLYRKVVIKRSARREEIMLEGRRGGSKEEKEDKKAAKSSDGINVCMFVSCDVF